MPKITITRPMLGWAPDFNSSNSAGVEGEEGHYTRSTAMSLWRNSRLGHIGPGEVFDAVADGSTKVNALPLDATVDSAGEAFAILENARIVQFGVGDDTVDAHNATAHGAHTDLTGEAILSYKDASDEYVLYSFNDATDGDVGRRKKSDGSYDDDYMSTVPTASNGSALTKGVPHPMVIGTDGLIYIGNGQYLAQFNQAAGTINYTKLNLGVGWVVTDLDVDGNYITITAYQATTYITSFGASHSRTFYWNPASSSFDFPLDLEDNYVSAAMKTNGAFYAFTSGKNSTTKVKERVGAGFETRFESAQIGQPPRRGSVDFYQNMVHYCPKSGSDLYAVDRGAFHYRTAVTTDGQTFPTDLGMVKNLSGNGLYIGRKMGSGSPTYDIVRINHSKYHIDAQLRTRVFELPYLSRIDKIVVYFSQFGTGASLLLSLFKDYNTLSIGGAADLLNKTLANSTYGAVSSISFRPSGITDVNAFYMNWKFNHASVSNTAAIVRKMEVYYSPTNKP